MHIWKVIFTKKSLKIPKGQSESVYRRRTDNKCSKEKSTKGQTTIYNIIGPGWLNELGSSIT